MVKKGLYFCLFFLFLTALNASDLYDQGLKDYREGRKNDAVANLTAALDADPFHDGACLYLGVIYQSMGNLARAEELYVKGRDMGGLKYQDLSFNLANLYFNKKEYDLAAGIYEELILTPGDVRNQSLLNLANLSVNSGSYPRAIDLYLEYLMEDPETPQREDIEKMVTLLRRAVEKAEQDRLAEEERIRQEEEAARQRELDEQKRLEEEERQRALAEQKRLEEEARQKALLESILNNLSSSAQETENITADSEQVEEDFGESDLDD